MKNLNISQEQLEEVTKLLEGVSRGTSLSYYWKYNAETEQPERVAAIAPIKELLGCSQECAVRVLISITLPGQDIPPHPPKTAYIKKGSHINKKRMEKIKDDIERKYSLIYRGKYVG